jgi:hypothetical protein
VVVRYIQLYGERCTCLVTGAPVRIRDVSESRFREQVVAAHLSRVAAEAETDESTTGRHDVQLQVGNSVEVLSKEKKVWRACTVIDVRAARDNSDKGRSATRKVKIHYDGFDQLWDEWLLTDDHSRLRTVPVPNPARDAGSEGNAPAGACSVVADGAAMVPVKSLSAVLALLRDGEAHKHFAATKMNVRSSRAHTIFSLYLTQSRTERGASGEVVLRRSRSQLQLVDLAGCEQIKKSGATDGQRKAEAVGINSSLLSLGRCITALAESRAHVPFLGSKLTSLLREALAGNSRTTFLVTASLDAVHAEETLSALKMGERCAMITTKAQAALGEFDTVSSLSAALSAVSDALHECRKAMSALKARGKQTLPSYHKLGVRMRALEQKELELAELHARMASGAE